MSLIRLFQHGLWKSIEPALMEISQAANYEK